MLGTPIHDAGTIARFWPKVDRREPGGCWDWTAGLWRGGYGKFNLSHPRRAVRAHVFSYEINVGSTNGLYVCHSCDRPPCCNPSHLWLGTNSDNQLDCVMKGRRQDIDQKGEANHRSVLVEDDILEIRRLIGAGLTNIAIGPMYGVTHSMISRIRLRKAWTHI